MKTVLITGVAGMVGSHLAEMLPKDENYIIGSYYKPTIRIEEIEGLIELIECDVRYYTGVYKLIEKYKPHVVYHLAAQSYPAVSWSRPQETMEVNVTGTINLFEAIKEVKSVDPSYDPVVVVACSSAEYGSALEQLEGPATEKTDLLPLHPYGISKVAQDLLAYQYYTNYGIRTIRARIFNTTGPRKENDVTADFTKRIVLMEKGKLEGNKLKVGNLTTQRAITDVRDLVSALVLLAEKGSYGEAYNISGSSVYQISDIVELIRKHTNLEFQTEEDPNLIRVTDEKIIYGDSKKLVNDTGWIQVYHLERTIKDMLDYWRAVL